MHHVFISYARRDRDRVEAVVEYLERTGVQVWIDRRDIPVSVPWLDEVVAAIAAADLVAVFRSAHEARSQACQLEQLSAQELTKQTIDVPVARDPQQAAEAITERLLALGPREQQHTEMIARAHHWEQEGRPASMLASRRLRRRLARSVALSHAPPPVAKAFLKASARRNRRRRVVALAGASVFLLSYLFYQGTQTAQKRTERTIAAANAAFAAAGFGYYESTHDTYDALAYWAARVAHGHTEYLTLEPLWHTLNVRVPDRVRRAPRAPHPAGGVQADSADGRWRAIADAYRGTVDVIATHGGALWRRMSTLRPASALAFSPDGRWLAIGQGPDVSIVELDTARERDVLRGSRGTVRRLRWTPDGARVWAWVDGWRAVSWRWRTGRILLDDPHDDFVALSPVEHGTVTAVTADGRLLTLDLRSRRVRTIATRARGTDSVAFDGPLVALTGLDDRITLFDRSSGRTRTLTIPDCGIGGVALTADGHLLHVACVDASVQTFETATLRRVRIVPISGGGSLRLLGLPSGELLVGGVHGELSDVAPSATQSVPLVRAHTNSAVFTLAASPDGDHATFAGVGAGKPLTAYTGNRASPTDEWTWNVSLLFDAGGITATAAAFSADAQLMAIGLRYGAVIVRSSGVDQNPGPRWTDLPGGVGGLAFTPGGRLLAASSAGVIESYPGCPWCDDRAAAGRRAAAEVAFARRHGLVPRSAAQLVAPFLLVRRR